MPRLLSVSPKIPRVYQTHNRPCGLNLDKIQGLGAPVASIGGAGTFDGIFVTGIIAVLLA